MSNNFPHCNSQTIREYLQLLGYTNGSRCFYRFFFPSGHPNKKADKGKSLESPFPAIPDKAIAQYQLEQRGCYLVVNGYGASDKDVICGKAFFIEHDQLATHVQHRLWEILKLPEPTFQVATGGKSIHSYWVLVEPIPIDQWKELQTDFLEYTDSDRTIKNPSRVMRVPGCWYINSAGQAIDQTDIVSKSGMTYSYDLLRSAIPRQEPVERSPNWYEFERAFKLPFNRSVPLEICLSRHSRSLLECGAPEGIRRDRAIALGKDLIGTAEYLQGIGQRFNGDPRQLLWEYALRCSPPYTEPDEIDKDWDFINKQAANPSLRPEQIEGCIKAWAWREHKSEYPVTQLVERTLNLATDSSISEDIEPEIPKLAMLYRVVERKLGDKLRLNTLTKEIELEGEPIDHDEIELVFALKHNISLPHNNALAIAARLARIHSYSPVCQYLDRVADQYKDSTILDKLADRYFGTDVPLYNSHLRNTLVSAVARAYQPGCKVDSVLILQGAEGTFKSTFYKTLASPPWFDDSMNEMSDIDERRKLHTVWIVEWAEIEQILKKRNTGKIKAFITTTTDRIRNPYGRSVKAFHRPSIFVGTTNETEIFVDPNGNRRFWVVPVQKRIDLERLLHERDAIWGAAVHLYRNKYKWYLSREEEEATKELREDFHSLDPWHEVVDSFVDNCEWITLERILSDCIQMDLERQNRESQLRIANILTKLGYKRGSRKRVENKVLRVWEKK